LRLQRFAADIQRENRRDIDDAAEHYGRLRQLSLAAR
jgi:hypothetical protein